MPYIIEYMNPAHSRPLPKRETLTLTQYRKFKTHALAHPDTIHVIKALKVNNAGTTQDLTNDFHSTV